MKHSYIQLVTSVGNNFNDPRAYSSCNQIIIAGMHTVRIVDPNDAFFQFHRSSSHKIYTRPRVQSHHNKVPGKKQAGREQEYVCISDALII